MDSEKFYFQIDYKGVKKTSSSEVGEGCSQGTIFVEVAADAFANSVDDAAIDSAVEEIALTTARQVACQNLAELENSSQSMCRLEELPPIIQEVEPTVQESGVRAWLSQGQIRWFFFPEIWAESTERPYGRTIPLPSSAWIAI